MEKVLQKMAKQLKSFDEASLMSLWSKYADSAGRFEPSQRWENDVLVLCLIQAVRSKNQLFNYHWAESQDGAASEPAKPAPTGFATQRPECSGSGLQDATARGKLLAFPGLPEEKGSDSTSSD